MPLNGPGRTAADNDSMKIMLSKDAQSLVEAARQRLKLWDISDEQIKKIEESGKPVRTMTLYSPVSGYVVQKMAFQGMRAMPGEKLFDIADLGIGLDCGGGIRERTGACETGTKSDDIPELFPGQGDKCRD